MIDKPVINTDLKKYDKAYVVEDDILWEVFGDGYSQAEVIWDKENICELLNEQQATITSLEDENLYRNFKLKSVDDLKKLKDIFETCMILIDGAIADEDLELGYESVFQFERRIKKFKGD